MLLAGLTVLVIGASHLAKPTYLIKTLHDELTERGAQVHSVGVCGVMPSEWLNKTTSRCGGAERLGEDPIVYRWRARPKPCRLMPCFKRENPMWWSS